MKIFDKLRGLIKGPEHTALKPTEPPVPKEETQIAPIPNIGVSVDEATEAMKQFGIIAAIAAGMFEGLTVVVKITKSEKSNNWRKMHGMPMRRRTPAEHRRRK